MNLCSVSHDELCYEGKTCPACDLKVDSDYWEEEVRKRDKEIEELKEKIDSLNIIH